MKEGRQPAQFQRETIVSSKLTPTSIPLAPNFPYQQLWIDNFYSPTYGIWPEDFFLYILY
jgi:hypothetical protein